MPVPRRPRPLPTLARLALTPLLALAACGDSGPEATPTASLTAARPALPRATAAAPIAARVTEASQLVTGLRADGQVGDWVLDNGVIRVIVQDAGRGALFHLYGGNILDADVVRAPGAAGGDLLGEVMTAINLRTLVAPEAMEVTLSGVDGQPARLRVTGATQAFPLFAPREPLPSLPLAVEEEYVLEPGASFLQIRTTFTNEGASTAVVDCGDLLFFGTELVLSAGGRPYGEGVGQVPYLTAHHDSLAGAAYGWTAGADSMVVPFEDASQSGALYEPRRIPAGDSRTCTRYLLVGDGSSSAVTDAYFALTRQVTGQLDVSAVDGAGARAAGAHAVITTPDGAYVTDLFTRADGPLSVDLPVGDYLVTLSSPSRATPEPAAVSIAAGRAVPLDLAVGPPSGLSVRCRDEAGAFTPCRAVLTDALGRRTFHFTASGSAELDAVPGAWSLTLSQGMERALVTASGTLAQGQRTTVSRTLARVLSTPGWVSMDTHLHAVRSNDSGTPLDKKVRTLVAEGVDVAVSTEHDRISDYGPTVAALGLGARLKTLVGNESSIIDYGHFNVFPLVVDPADPDALSGSQYWFEEASNRPLGAAELFAKMRENPGEEIVQVNHPRSGGKGYFDMIGYNPVTGRALREPLAEDFDCLEVQTSVFGDDAVLIDFLSLTNEGMRVTAMGSSDGHVDDDHNGMPRTYVRVPTEDLTALTDADLTAALKAQAATVSSGIFATITAAGPTGELADRPGQTVVGRGGPTVLTVTLTAADWASLSAFTLFEDGAALPLSLGADGVWRRDDAAGVTEAPLSPAAAEGRLTATVTAEVSPSRDASYVLLAWGTTEQPLSGQLPIALVNPVYVDRDGDGWEAPGPGLRIGPLPRWPGRPTPTTEEDLE